MESLSDLTLALLNSIPREAVFGLPNLYAIDGKARKAALTESGKCEIDVSIFDVATGVTVAKAAVAAKEGEAPVARDLVAAHASRLPPGYFAADAGIACRELAALIARIGHDFLFPVKGNAGKIFDEVKGLSWEDVASWESAEKGHGRWETRETKIIRLNAEETEKQIPSAVFFPQGLIYLEVTRTRINQKTFESSWEKAYFLATENNGAVTTQVSDALIRGYWSIENNLHGHRDIELGEDYLSFMSSHSSRIIGSILDVMHWLAQGCGRGIRYFREQLRAASVSLFMPWMAI